MLLIKFNHIKEKWKIRYFLLGLMMFFYYLNAIGQQNKIDSLLMLLNSTNQDTTKVNTLNKLGRELMYSNPDTSILISRQALHLAEKLNWKKGIATSYINIGKVYKSQSNNSEALENYFFALKIREAMYDKVGIADSYGKIGNVYYSQGNYPEALKNYFLALKINEAIGNKGWIAKNYGNIGNVYFSQGNFSQASKFYFADLKIAEAIGDKEGIAHSYGNIGNVYFSQGNYPEALKHQYACLKTMEEIGNKGFMALSYGNIASVYAQQGNYREALKNHLASLRIKEKTGDKEGIAASYVNIGNVFSQQKKYNEAEKNLIKGRELSRAIGHKVFLKEAYRALTELDSAKGNYKGAYENHKLYIIYRDSIDNEDTRKKTIQTQMTYDFEKKEAATQAEQDKKNIIAKEELKQKEQQRNYFIVGFALVGLLSIFILKGYKQKQKANIIITIQKDEVEKSKHIIEEKNKDITDSITYAKRIQRAMLPHRRDIWAAFPQSFVLFKPKDIVSGDFYFFHKNNKSCFIATADCTGHGVPGAFMSMVGAGKLNDAVSESSDTSEILKLLNKGIKTALKQSENDESTRDGMDIALCSVDTEKRIVRYAGANRPLWIIRNGQKEVEEIKATKNAIGGLTSDNQHFDSHELQLEHGDTFYLTTDGYADQFSGKTGKN